MTALSAQPRHDHADLRRLREFGITPLHWRRSLIASRTPLHRCVLVLHDGAATGPLLDDLLRAMKLAGVTPQLSERNDATASRSDTRIIQLGRSINTTISSIDSVPALSLPALTELRGNAEAKRAAWSTLRILLPE